RGIDDAAHRPGEPLARGRCDPLRHPRARYQPLRATACVHRRRAARAGERGAGRAGLPHPRVRRFRSAGTERGFQAEPLAAPLSHGFLTIWTAFSTARSFPEIWEMLVAVIVTTPPV